MHVAETWIGPNQLLLILEGHGPRLLNGVGTSQKVVSDDAPLVIIVAKMLLGLRYLLIATLLDLVYLIVYLLYILLQD